MQEFIKVKQKRKRFNYLKSVRTLEGYIKDLPSQNEVYKFVTDGKFSSISFIQFIAQRSRIKEMHVSSLRIGKKELRIIDILHQNGIIGMCHFVVSTLMSNDSESKKKYGYYDNLASVCKANGWECHGVNNHSKVLLFDTEDGKYILETSSNLNENPKIEQFSFERSEELYNFYRAAFEKWENDRM